MKTANAAFSILSPLRLRVITSAIFLIKPDGKAVDPARQAQVDAANNARKAIGMTAPAVVKPVAPVVKPVAPVVKPIAPVVKPIAPVVKPIATIAKPKGVPSGQGGAGIDEY